ncbi:MAG: hypothetical protein Q4G13_08690 [Moraxella sp.]|nr:hypothetical protein [Moraxella sp.]
MTKYALLALLFSPMLAFSATWVKYDTESNNTTYYYDKDSVKIHRFSNGTKYIRVWEKSVYNKPQSNTADIDPILSSMDWCGTGGLNRLNYCDTKYTAYYDCWHDKLATGRVIYYAKNGNVVKSLDDTVNTTSSNSWLEIVPDSIGDDTLKEICHTYSSRLK